MGLHMIIEKLQFEELEEILLLQKLAYQSEAQLYNDYTIPPLTETLDDLKEDYKNKVILKAVSEGRIVGSVRAYEENGVCHISRLFVHPSCQNSGAGKMLLEHIEACFAGCVKYALFTGKRSIKNLYLYNKLGYKSVREEVVNDKVSLVYLEKENEESHAISLNC